MKLIENALTMNDKISLKRMYFFSPSLSHSLVYAQNVRDGNKNSGILKWQTIAITWIK